MILENWKKNHFYLVIKIINVYFFDGNNVQWINWEITDHAVSFVETCITCNSTNTENCEKNAKNLKLQLCDLGNVSKFTYFTIALGAFQNENVPHLKYK